MVNTERCAVITSLSSTTTDTLSSSHQTHHQRQSLQKQEMRQRDRDRDPRSVFLYQMRINRLSIHLSIHPPGSTIKSCLFIGPLRDQKRSSSTNIFLIQWLMGMSEYTNIKLIPDHEDHHRHLQPERSEGSIKYKVKTRFDHCLSH